MSTTTVSDVFLSYAQSDTAWAAVVQQKLGEAGFKVFTVAGVPSGDNASDLIWDALTESAALIALVRGPGGMSKSLAVEIGAAMAWQKPVYVLYEGDKPPELPKYAERFGVFRASDIEKLIRQIDQVGRPLSEHERAALVGTYVSVGVPTDQLLLQPAKFQQLADSFNKTTRARISGERLLREIVRLRKQGKLPRLGHKSTKVRMRGTSRQKAAS